MRTKSNGFVNNGTRYVNENLNITCISLFSLSYITGIFVIFICMQKRDLEAFEKDRHLTALQYRSLKKRGAPFIEREHSIRGIEDLLDMDDSNRKHISTPSHREQHLRAVLDEQERQKQAKSFPNEAMLREISLKYSRESRNNAAALAEADALSGYVSSKRQVVQRHVQGVMRSVSRKMLLNG